MKVLVLLLTLPVNAAIGKPTGTQITSTIVELQKAGSPILISNPFGNPIGKNSNSYQSKALADTARSLKDTGAGPLKIRASSTPPTRYQTYIPTRSSLAKPLITFQDSRVPQDCRCRDSFLLISLVGSHTFTTLFTVLLPA